MASSAKCYTAASYTSPHLRTVSATPEWRKGAIRPAGSSSDEFLHMIMELDRTWPTNSSIAVSHFTKTAASSAVVSLRPPQCPKISAWRAAATATSARRTWRCQSDFGHAAVRKETTATSTTAVPLSTLPGAARRTAAQRPLRQRLLRLVDQAICQPPLCRCVDASEGDFGSACCGVQSTTGTSTSTAALSTSSATMRKAAGVTSSVAKVASARQPSYLSTIAAGAPKLPPNSIRRIRKLRAPSYSSVLPDAVPHHHVDAALPLSGEGL